MLTTAARLLSDLSCFHRFSRLPPLIIESRTLQWLPFSPQIYPTTAGKLERLASAGKHRVFLSCPVFGIPNAAEEAELVFAISGDYFARKHAAHALVPAIGKRIMDLGSNVERATAFKWVLVHPRTEA